MHNTQLAASNVVRQVLTGRNLNQVLSATQHSLQDPTPQQRGALQDLSYGTLRFYGQLTALLKQLLHKPLSDEQVRCLLLIALYQLLYSKADSFTVVDQAVRAAKKIQLHAGGLVNAVLRNFVRQQAVLLQVAAQSEEGRYSYPQWWIDKIKIQYGAQAEKILLAGNQHPPMTLRVNRHHHTSAEYLALLARHGIAARLIPPDAIQLEHAVTVDKLPGFFDGLVSVQDAGAQYAAPLLDVQDGMRVLDACAAPGGKSTHLLELANIDLLALDKDAERLTLVQANLRRLHLSVKLQTGDAARSQDWWDGKPFQRILADVPCSASGVVRRHPDIKWLRRPADIAGFAQQQHDILHNLWSLLEGGGKFLYASCSVFARENQQVVDEFIRHQPDARLLPMPAIADISTHGQLLPDDRHDGFFYALLHKQSHRN